MIVMGTAAGLSADLSPGDLVVASEVTDGETTVALPGADLLAAELRRAGLTARAGRLIAVQKLVKSAERVRLAADGYLAADMETAALLDAANGRPMAVIRAVSDAGVGPGMASSGLIRGGIAALRSLRKAAPVAEKWAAACRERTVLLAGPRSFCAGVERAIEIVERALEMRGAPVYVRKQIVHNTRVVSDLEERGAVFVDELDEVPDGATVVFSAHGVSPAVRDDASGRGLSVIDATCPLVSKVHAEARRFAREGYTVALIGHEGHEEVEGTLGEAPPRPCLVQTAGGRGSACPCRTRPRSPTSCRPRSRSTRRPTWRAHCATSSRRCERRARTTSATPRPTGRPPSAPSPPRPASCSSPTANSSNSVRLVERSERAGTPAHLIDGATDIDLSWLSGVSVVGLTAGASAPPAVVSEIIAALSGLGP